MSESEFGKIPEGTDLNEFSNSGFYHIPQEDVEFPEKVIWLVKREDYFDIDTNRSGVYLEFSDGSQGIIWEDGSMEEIDVRL